VTLPKGTPDYQESRLGWAGKAPASAEYQGKGEARWRPLKKNSGKAKIFLALSPNRPYICYVAMQGATLGHVVKQASWTGAIQV